MEKRVFDAINEIIYFAKEHEVEFIRLVMNSQNIGVEKIQTENKKQLAKLLKREKELDKLFANLYEDKVLGNLTENQFQKLSAQFQTEQNKVLEQIGALEKLLASAIKQEVNIDTFLKLIGRKERMERLDMEALYDCIDFIIVHHREKRTHCDNQKIEIYFHHIGKVEIPILPKQKAGKTTKVA